MCSQLQGKVFCDCINWKGVCVYQEYVWNRSHHKDRRKTYSFKVLDIKYISPAVSIVTIKINRTLVRELNQPGAYVFLRSVIDPLYFDIPMSVMRIDEKEETLEIAIQERGVKSKSLLGSTGIQKDILLRGPYWNGLLGLKYIKGFHSGKALILTRGIGQAPALMVARKLRQGGNSVEVILDTGKINVDFTGKNLEEMGCHVVTREVLDVPNLVIPSGIVEYVKESIINNGVGLIYCAGPEILHRGISDLIKETGKDCLFACSNDTKICCGEGICGSCDTRLPDGKRVKVCKTQLNPIDIYGGR
jgi:NAD(P)H-flavin reductase